MVDNHYIRTLVNGLLAKIKSIRFDWGVNDSSQEGYIKNRTHWSETKEIVLLPETEYEFFNVSTMDSAGVSYYVADFILPFSQTDYTVGDVIKITWDNTDYYNVVLQEYWNEGFFGNLALFYYIQTGSTEYPEGMVDTGEPFFMLKGTCVTLSTDASHTISMAKIGEVVHKLDKKYLPDGLITKDEAYTKDEVYNKDELADVATSGNYYDLINRPIVYSDVVLYSTTQHLTNTQKSKARTNIDAQKTIIGTAGQVVGFDSSGNAIAQEAPKSVPEVTTTDNGKFLRVVDGVWSATTVPNAEEVAF